MIEESLPHRQPVPLVGSALEVYPLAHKFTYQQQDHVPSYH